MDYSITALPMTVAYMRCWNQIPLSIQAMLILISMPLQVCNHKFHNECLKGWGDTSCPVCRYCHETSAAQSHCQACFTHCFAGVLLASRPWVTNQQSNNTYVCSAPRC